MATGCRHLGEAIWVAGGANSTGRMTQAGMSSRYFQKLEGRPCPECSDGKLRDFVASKEIERDGVFYTVQDLLPLRCDACQTVVWPLEENERARRVVDLMQRSRAT